MSHDYQLLLVNHVFFKFLDMFLAYLHEIVCKVLKLLIPEFKSQIHLILIPYVEALEVLWLASWVYEMQRSVIFVLDWVNNEALSN